MFLSVALVLMTFGIHVGSDDGNKWAGWRGPNGSGVAKDGAPPSEWSEDKNVSWKLEIPGKGLASPSIWGDLIFVATAVSTGKQAAPLEEPDAGESRGRGGRSRRSAPLEEQEFFVIAVDRQDGSIVWKTKVNTAMPHEGTHGDGSFASATTATDGEHVIASFGSYGLYALSMEGEVQWGQDLGDMNVQGAFGEGSSPVLSEGVVIQNWDHEGDSFIVALSKEDGSEFWRRERPSGTSWCTPLIVDVNGEKQVIVAGEKIISYNFDTGEDVWILSTAASQEAESETGRGGRGGRRGGRGENVKASPVCYDGVLYVCTGSAFHAVSLEGLEGEVNSDDVAAWSVTRDLPSIPSPLVYEGIVYLMKSNSGILSALNSETGVTHYGPERLKGVSNAYASPVAVGGKLYFCGRDGTIEVVTAGPEFKSVAVNTLDDRFDASPAIVDGKLYLRGLKYLYCVAND